MIEVILTLAILLIVLLLILLKKSKEKQREPLKENMCNCSGPFLRRKQTKSLDLSNPAGYQAKRQEGGYDFIAV